MHLTCNEYDNYVPQLSVKIIRDDGTEAEPNELGRIVCRLPMAPGTMLNLYRADDRFKKTYFEKFVGYYDTSDAGVIDEHGYVQVMAREDDVINVAGHRLSTAALEEAVLEHPEVVDCAVVGVPDQLKGHTPLAIYIRRAGTVLHLSRRELKISIILGIVS